jgi:hypothetical protein
MPDNRCLDCQANPCECEVYVFGHGDTIGEQVGSIFATSQPINHSIRIETPE